MKNYIITFLILIILSPSIAYSANYSNPVYLKKAAAAYKNQDYGSCIKILRPYFNSLYNKEKYLLALALKQDKKYEDSLKIFKEIFESSLILKNHIAMHAAEICYSTGKFDKALEYYNYIIKESSETYLLKKAYFVTGEIYLKYKNYDKAISNFITLLTYYSEKYSYIEDVLLGEVTYPDILHEIGDIYIIQGKYKPAFKYLKKIVENYSNSTAALNSALKIDSIRNHINYSDAFEFKRLKILHAKRKYSHCKNRLARLLNRQLKKKNVNKRFVSKLRYMLGYELYKTGHSNKAMKHFNIITKYYTVFPECPKSLFYMGLIKREKYLEYMKSLIINHRDSYFSFAAFKELIEHYKKKNDNIKITKVLNWMIRYFNGDRKYLRKSLWLKLFFSYNNQNLEQSLDTCRKLKKILTNDDDRTKLNFWYAVIYKKMNNNKKFNEYIEANMKLDSRENFYYWRSFYLNDKKQYPDRKKFKRDLSPDSGLIKKIESFVKPEILKTKLISLLAILGCYDEIFNIIKHEPFDKTKDVNRSLSSLAYIAGDYYYSILYARYYKNSFYSNPEDFDFWTLLYPDGFSKEINRHIKQTGIPYEYVLSIIREESRFTKNALSLAGAVGLMQIMPSTGKIISRRVGYKNFSSKDLYDHKVNIEFGISELNSLYTGYKEKYDDFTSMVFTAAAYNAGKNRVAKWIDIFFKKNDINFFIENIPYKETNRYVKKVLKSYYIYKGLY